MRTNLFIVCISLMLSATAGVCQPSSIAYLIPDIGAPGTNTLVEVIAPVSTRWTFGSDGVSLNNPGSSVEVRCANSSDTNAVNFGPAIVSWDGRAISVQAFVSSLVRPNSSDWVSLEPRYRIPIEVLINGIMTGQDTFYLVQPQPILHIKQSGQLGAGGAFGIRSRRGAMIVQGISVDSKIDSLGISTKDCDPWTPGNQGYLPATILCLGAANLSLCATLDLGARLINGGPGGGGGGAAFADIAPDPSNTRGGDGFTGGQGGTLDGGIGSGSSGYGNTHGGQSLNGVLGPHDVVGSDLWGTQQIEGGQGTGGGTGFCFGTSGQGNRTQNCVFDNSIGGYGGGSGASECCCGVFQAWTAFGSGGGGFGTAGTSHSSGGGQVNGNPELTPMAGGSGGGGGNPWAGVSGYGGGGGGALLLYSIHSLTCPPEIHSDGGDGGDQTIQSAGIYSGSGGGGSGGGILLASKLGIAGQTISVEGGGGGVSSNKNPYEPADVQDGGAGGSGRVRLDGLVSGQVAVTADASLFWGPTTDTSHLVPRTFTLTGTGSGSTVHVYLRSEHTPWFEASSVAGYAMPSWSATITLPGKDTLYYLAAAEETPNPSSSGYEAVPAMVYSQASANILITHSDCSQSVLQFPQPLVRGHVGMSLNYEMHIQLHGINADSILSRSRHVDYAISFDSNYLQVQSVIPPAGWLVQSQSVDPGLLQVRLIRANGSVHALDSLGSVLFSVISAARKNTSLKLQALSITDSVNNVAFCPFEGEGDAWVILLDSLTAGVRYEPTGIGISSVYPNPTSHLLNINVDNDREAILSISLLDVLGREMSSVGKRIKAHAGRSMIQLDAEGLAQGVYLLRVETPGGIATRQVQIIR